MTKALRYQDLASEADIQKGVCELLRILAIPFSLTDASRVWNPKGEVRRSKVEPGWPDLSGTLPFNGSLFGRALYIETKSFNGAVSDDQRRCHEVLRKAGAIVLVPKSVEDLARMLFDIGVRHSAIDHLLG
jgi:hypothetical protein